MNRLVAVLGYNPNGMPGGREPEKIWRERIGKALELQQTLDTDLMISGEMNTEANQSLS